jgi:hypothetical protein
LDALERTRIGLFVAALAAAACGGAITLHPPTCAPSAARQPTPVSVEPITPRADATRDSTVSWGHPTASEVVTAAIKSELAARALEGGEPGGYRVRCTLDRFALRSFPRFAGTGAVVVLYIDLGCDVDRALDHGDVWKGALRGRAIASATAAPATDSGLVQTLVDRTLSDASREIASDLAVRVLGLGGVPSARVFADEAARSRTAGIDDSPFGQAALAETIDRAEGKLALSTRDLDPATRAGAWNAIAMAAGPGDPVYAGQIKPDEEAVVRFYQYKALARAMNPASLTRLRGLATRDEEPYLAELANDALATGGLGVPRRRNASAATNGATTSP